MLFRACPPEARTPLGAQPVADHGVHAVVPFPAGALGALAGPLSAPSSSERTSR